MLTQAMTEAAYEAGRGYSATLEAAGLERTLGIIKDGGDLDGFRALIDGISFEHAWTPSGYDFRQVCKEIFSSAHMAALSEVSGISPADWMNSKSRQSIRALDVSMCRFVERFTAGSTGKVNELTTDPSCPLFGVFNSLMALSDYTLASDLLIRAGDKAIVILAKNGDLGHLVMQVGSKSLCIHAVEALAREAALKTGERATNAYYALASIYQPIMSVMSRYDTEAAELATKVVEGMPLKGVCTQKSLLKNRNGVVMVMSVIEIIACSALLIKDSSIGLKPTQVKTLLDDLAALDKLTDESWYALLLRRHPEGLMALSGVVNSFKPLDVYDKVPEKVALMVRLLIDNPGEWIAHANADDATEALLDDFGL